MRIVKNIIGTLEVDTDSKKIWINTLFRCFLRIYKVNFNNVVEKFSMIDITGEDVYFYPLKV